MWELRIYKSRLVGRDSSLIDYFFYLLIDLANFLCFIFSVAQSNSSPHPSLSPCWDTMSLTKSHFWDRKYFCDVNHHTSISFLAGDCGIVDISKNFSWQEKLFFLPSLHNKTRANSLPERFNEKNNGVYWP